MEINLSPEDYWKKLDQSEKLKEKPKKKLIGNQFTGKVDKDKMGKRRRDENRTSLRKKSTTVRMLPFFIGPGKEAIFHIRLTLLQTLEDL